MKTNKSYIIPCVNAVDLEGECLLADSGTPARAAMHEGYEEETESTPTINWSNSDAWQ